MLQQSNIKEIVQEHHLEVDSTNRNSLLDTDEDVARKLSMEHSLRQANTMVSSTKFLTEDINIREICL